MSDPGPQDPERSETPKDASEDDAYVLPDELILGVEEALNEGRVEAVEALIQPLHPADLADLFEYLTRDERHLLTDICGATMDAEALTLMDPGIREEVIEHLGLRGFVRKLSELDSDDAVEIFSDLDQEVQHRLLTALPQAYRMLLEESLSYPEDSAGRMMQREMVVVPSAWSVGETIDHMRSAENLPDDFYDLFIVNPMHKPIGSIPLSRVLRSRRQIRLTEIMDEELRTIPIETDEEDVGYLFQQYGLVSAPVVDDAGRLVGVITVDDAVHAIDEAAEDDLMKLAGVTETDVYRASFDTAKARLPWLVVNLATAVMASLVIGLFESTIERIVALAVLMPIVASMGGNAGTQTLTVAVRALATKDLTAANTLRFVGKELLVGTANGILFALLAGLVAWLWFKDPALGLVIAAAMIVNMIVAGLSGTLIPLALERVGVDPAIASSVFLTTVTDVVGFFAFLGLAAIFLL